MFETWVPLFAGFVLLVSGGDLLVRGAVAVAARMGISPLVIGLTLVGFGTSMPELVTSVQAGLAGAPGIAYGNIVGSNLANILLIAGISALICPVVIARSALRRDAVVMLAAAAGFAALAMVLPMGRVVGGGLILLLVTYLWVVIAQERAGMQAGAIGDKVLAAVQVDPALAQAPPGRPIAVSLGIALVGLVLVVGGGSLLVDGATSLARGLGVSEAVIGLSIVAVGTSLPELVTSVIAALKRQGDVAFGNVVGSNIYNILGIGGTTALIAPSDVPEQIVWGDAPVMVGVTVLFVVFAATGLRIGRREGGVLLAGYLAYVWIIWT